MSYRAFAAAGPAETLTPDNFVEIAVIDPPERHIQTVDGRQFSRFTPAGADGLWQPAATPEVITCLQRAVTAPDLSIYTTFGSFPYDKERKKMMADSEERAFYLRNRGEEQAATELEDQRKRVDIARFEEGEVVLAVLNKLIQGARERLYVRVLPLAGDSGITAGGSGYIAGLEGVYGVQNLLGDPKPAVVVSAITDRSVQGKLDIYDHPMGVCRELKKQ